MEGICLLDQDAASAVEAFAGFQTMGSGVVPLPGYQKLIALRASGGSLFEADIAQIDKVEVLLSLSGQPLDGGSIGSRDGVAVGGVVAGEMIRNIGIQIPEEPCDGLDLLIGIVFRRDYQGRHLQVDPL